MRIRSKILLMLLLVLAVPVAADRADAAEKKAICPVCRVMEGESEEEHVKAHRTYQGVEYGFCSKECAEAFDADPVAFLPPVFPRKAPVLELKDLDGKPIPQKNLEGRYVLLDFWATWCVPCRKSMPELQTLQDEFGSRGFTVVGVSIDEPKHLKRVKKFIEDREITYPIALDTEKQPAWDAYRVKAIPAAFLIDPKGRIVAQWTGIPATGDEVRSRLEEVLGDE